MRLADSLGAPCARPLHRHIVASCLATAAPPALRAGRLGAPWHPHASTRWGPVFDGAPPCTTHPTLTLLPFCTSPCLTKTTPKNASTALTAAATPPATPTHRYPPYPAGRALRPCDFPAQTLPGTAEPAPVARAFVACLPLCSPAGAGVDRLTSQIFFPSPRLKTLCSPPLPLLTATRRTALHSL